MAIFTSPTVARLWQRYRSVAWIALVLTFVGIFLLRSGSDLKDALPLIRDADPVWVIAALLSQLAIIFCISAKFQLVFNRLGSHVTKLALTRAHMRRFTVSTVVPLGGPAAVAQFVRDLMMRQVPPTTTLYGSFLVTIINEVAFALFLTPVLAWLIFSGHASTTMLAGAGAIFGVVLLSTLCAILLVREGPFQRKVQDKLPLFVQNGLVTVRKHSIRPQDILPALPYSIFVNLFGVAMLTFSLWAVGIHPSLTTILAARVVASVTLLMLPIFQGAGALEMTVLSVFVAGGIPAPDAIAAIAVFRVAQFWFPLMLGGIAFIPQVRMPRITKPRVAISSSVASIIAAIFILR